MRHISKVLVIAAFVTALFLPTIVSAQDASTQRMNSIRTNCSLIKSNIDLQRRRDLVARTNRGREYESINKQLDAFGQRVKNNKISGQNFDSLLGDFQRQTSQFRSAYENYDNSLGSLQQINCQNDPGKFSDNLNQARQLRETISGTASNINSVLVLYRKEVVKLKAQLQQVGQSVGGNR